MSRHEIVAGRARGLLTAVSRALRGGAQTDSGGHRVVSVAAALFSSTVVTAALGFAFWAFAAHATTADVVGRSAAVIAAMQFISAFATLGLQTLLVAELPGRAGTGLKRLVVVSLEIVGAVAFAAAIAFALIHRAVGQPEWMYSTATGVALFGFGTAVETMTIVVDGALVGAGQSGRQVSRNLVFATVKLVVLVLAWLVLALSPLTTFLAWLSGNLVSLLILTRRSKALSEWLRAALSVRGLGSIRRTAAGHLLVNLGFQAPRLALPVLVSLQVSDGTNAAFYTALLLAMFIWIIPTHLGTAMFALNSEDPRQLHAGLNSAVRLSVVVSVAAAVGAPILAGPVLSIFGTRYEEARYCLVALVVCTFASAVKSIFISVERARGALGRASLAALVGAFAELSAAQVGLKFGGLTGVGLGVGAAMILEAACFWPFIATALRAESPKRHCSEAGASHMERSADL